jgi:hypothetical protein
MCSNLSDSSQSYKLKVIAALYSKANKRTNRCQSHLPTWGADRRGKSPLLIDISGYFIAIVF